MIPGVSANKLDNAANDTGREWNEFPSLGTSVRGPRPIDRAAYYGLAGHVVRSIAPHTEADPTAILLQYMALFGNAIGRGPYFQVEGDHHATNIFVVLVGATAKARKGTSMGRVRQIFDRVDPQWASQRIESGMSSGEGLIWAVRDPIVGWSKG